MSLLYSKLYSLLNCRKITKFCGYVASLTEVTKKTISGRVESAPFPREIELRVLLEGATENTVNDLMSALLTLLPTEEGGGGGGGLMQSFLKREVTKN